MSGSISQLPPNEHLTAPETLTLMTVLIIAPHPDDESIGCGGAVRLHCLRGDRVVVVFLTSGELGLKDLPAKKACRIREQEARAATKILGAAKPVFLRQRDWFLADNIAATIRALRPVLKAEAPSLIYA